MSTYNMTNKEKEKRIKKLKPMTEFYCYYHILKLILDGKKEVTTTSVLDTLSQKDFFKECYISDEVDKDEDDDQAIKKRVQRLITDVYNFHGESALSDQLIERKRQGNQYVYSMVEGTTSPLDKSVIDSVMPLKLVKDSLVLPPIMKKQVSEGIDLAANPRKGGWELWKDRFLYRVPVFEPFPPMYTPLHEEFLSIIESAIENSDAIEIEYTGKKRKLDPYGIFAYGQTFYLIAGERFNVKESDPLKYFKIHRMKSVKKLDNYHPIFRNKKDDFSIEKFVFSENGRFFNGGERIEIKLKFYKKHGKNIIIEDCGFDSAIDIIEEQDEYYIAKAEATDCLDFEKWLKNNVSYVEILEPLEIRSKVHSALKEGLKRYSDM